MAAADVHGAGGGLRNCGKAHPGWTVYAERGTTSCRFARNVWRSVRRYFRNRPIRPGHRFRVRAYSPVTRRRYRMRCAVAPRHIGDVIVCSGARGANVRFEA
jgi:hypothetical protein